LLNLTKRIAPPALALGILILAGCGTASRKDDAGGIATVSRLEAAEALGSLPARQDQKEEEQVDRIALTNGDRLSGVVKGLTNGKLVLETRHSGEVAIAWDEVATLDTTTVLAVETAGGARHEGTVHLDASGILRVKPTAPGRPMSVPRHQVVAIQGPDTALPAPPPAEKKDRGEYADVVTLENGDVLTGVLEGYDGSRLEIETRHSDLIRVRWSQVATIKTKHPVRVELITRDVVAGVLTMDDEGFITIESNEMEEPFVIHRSQISRMDRRKSRWEGSFSLSANVNDGSSDTSSFLFKFDLWWKGPSDTISVKGNATYNTAGGSATDNTAYGQVRYDYLLGAGTYVFGSLEADHDEFQEIRLRTVWTGGGGYAFLQRNWIELTTDLGVSYTTEEDRDRDTSSYPGGRAGLRFKWELGADFEIHDVLTFYPNFQDGDAWRFRNEVSLKRSVYKGWNIDAGIITRYENQPLGDAQRASSTYYLGLGYTF